MHIHVQCIFIIAIQTAVGVTGEWENGPVGSVQGSVRWGGTVPDLNSSARERGIQSQARADD